MKVYIVTFAECNSTNILGVFSSMEGAEKYIQDSIETGSRGYQFECNYEIVEEILTDE